MTLDQQWFSEVDENNNSAFSLKIKAKLHEEKTPYQTIAIYDTISFGHLMTIDGCTMLSQRDNFLYHEMMTHPALFSHADPKCVVIIGGGDCGTLQQVLQHDCVESVTQVDIDERVTRLSEEYFPELCKNNDDPRANLQFDDGIQYIKNLEPESVDIIIVDSTDPIGPAEGLFNLAFHQSCLASLRPNGLIVQQSESPIFHKQHILTPLRTSFTNAGFSDVQTLYFPQPIYPSGWWSATVACKNDSIRFQREQIAECKTFSTQYYNSGTHKAAFATPEFMKVYSETISA